MAPVNADQGLVIVPAGAGAGKTHRIKTQLSDWVKRGIVRPERILAVTFTEAAAGELRERIRAGLLADGLVAEAMAVERAYVSTIHGLGLRLLTEHALAAGASPQPRHLGDAERDLLIRQALAHAKALDPIKAAPERFGYAPNFVKGETVEDSLRARVLSMIDLLRGLGDKGRDAGLIAPALTRLDAVYGPVLDDPIAATTALRTAVQVMIAAFPEGGMAGITAKTNVEKLEKNLALFKRVDRAPDLLDRDWQVWNDLRSLFNSNRSSKTPAGYDDLATAIMAAADVVRRIQTEELDETLTGEFETSARQFYAALRPYVLRRDKRSDPEFCVFKDSHGDYREVTDIPVSPEAEGFTRDWLRRFCAAEALSLLPQDDPRVKRVRLAVAQGYGFGFGEDEEDSPSGMTDANLVGPAGFWTEAFTAESNDIYSHPAILAAVRQIEAYTRAGEKVLVFGRFLTPMNVLTRLLDAREMLRRLRDGQHWPASGIGESNIAAVIAAMRDPDLAVAGGVDEIDVMLKTRYQEWASERRAELARLHRELEDLALEGGTAAFLSEILRHEDGKQDLQFGALLEALGGRREVAGASWTGREMLGLFEKLLLELAGDDEAENNDTQKARLDAWLNDYSGREGNFARMMSGATAPQTRRMLQSAFNRSSSWPMVLLAQSRVGREGLNLHEACRTVILLHAEWNPGIVEQQIGRVDRKNSLWLREWRKWRDHGDGLPPRIRVHPVVVSGTYDDHNWQVLKARWLELRAQLHGDVLRPVPGRSEVIDDKRTCADRVRRAVPDFSPGKRGG